MDILEISKLPTCLRIEGEGIRTEGRGGYHESVLRAFNILSKVKSLLELGTPSSVILEVIAVMESGEGGDFVVTVDSSEAHMKRVLNSIEGTRGISE